MRLFEPSYLPTRSFTGSWQMQAKTTFAMSNECRGTKGGLSSDDCAICKNSHCDTANCRFARKFFDLLLQLSRFLTEFTAFTFDLFLLLLAHHVENRNVALRKVVEFVIRAFFDLICRLDDFH